MIERLGLDAEALKLRRLRAHLGWRAIGGGPRASYYVYSGRLDHARSMLSNTCYDNLPDPTEPRGGRAVYDRR